MKTIKKVLGIVAPAAPILFLAAFILLELSYKIRAERKAEALFEESGIEMTFEMPKTISSNKQAMETASRLAFWGEETHKKIVSILGVTEQELKELKNLKDGELPMVSHFESEEKYQDYYIWEIGIPLHRDLDAEVKRCINTLFTLSEDVLDVPTYKFNLQKSYDYYRFEDITTVVRVIETGDALSTFKAAIEWYDNLKWDVVPLYVAHAIAPDLLMEGCAENLYSAIDAGDPQEIRSAIYDAKEYADECNVEVPALKEAQAALF